MKRYSKRTLVGIGLAFLLVFPVGEVASAGLVGDCSNCHTMHNSEQGNPVARVGTDPNADPVAAPIQNLLKYDCIACHANDPTGGTKLWALGDSSIPQVMHGTDDNLAGGNFRYIAESGNRKGHNVYDLVSADSENAFPPGHRHASDVADRQFKVDQFTCAGYMGCHGYRGQVLTSTMVTCDEFGNNTDTGEPCTEEELAISGEPQNTYRTGLSALSGFDGPSDDLKLKTGTHHRNYDGLKSDGTNPDFYDNPLVHSYRFIRALRGYGNEVDRWQNANKDSHNEYAGGYAETAYGELIKNTDFATTDSCSLCHLGGRESETSRITTPSQSITGFCITCHGLFHSSGATNGESGAFLRHPSDYVIPDEGEYQAYTVYDVTAPVARPSSFFVDGMTPSSAVVPGRDQVMCLSCHVAHASQYDYMLRFDYSDVTAMNAGAHPDTDTATAAGGCLACHTVKGVNPDNR